MFHPSKHEVEAERYLRAGLDGFVAEVTRDPAIHAIDLLEYYRVNNIMTKENASDFFWKLDYHNNTKGYQAMGNAIAHKIVELQLID